MNPRFASPAFIAFLILAAGCATRTPAPGADSGSFKTSGGDALKAAGAGVRQVRIYVDAVPVLELRNGVPVINTAHAAGAGRAAVAALQEAFNAHGFRAERGEFTSIGLGSPVTPVLLTHGPEAPEFSTLPVVISPGLPGSDRAEWIKSLFAEVRAFAASGTAQDSLTATYLSPNLSRIEVFAALTGGDGPQARISLVAFDSRTGRVLWTSGASESASVLDMAVATSLVRRLAGGLPVLGDAGR